MAWVAADGLGRWNFLQHLRMAAVVLLSPQGVHSAAWESIRISIQSCLRSGRFLFLLPLHREAVHRVGKASYSSAPNEPRRPNRRGCGRQENHALEKPLLPQGFHAALRAAVLSRDAATLSGCDGAEKNVDRSTLDTAAQAPYTTIHQELHGSISIR